MKQISQSNELDAKIALLQSKQRSELILLRDQFHLTYESLKPSNLIKTTWHEVTKSPEIRNNIVNTAIGLTTGYISKKVLFGSTGTPVKKLIGTIVQFAISKMVSAHADTMRSAGKNLLQLFSRHSNGAKKSNS